MEKLITNPFANLLHCWLIPKCNVMYFPGEGILLEAEDMEKIGISIRIPR